MKYPLAFSASDETLEVPCVEKDERFQAAPVAGSTAVPAGQRPAHAQSAGGAAPPGQAEPAGHGAPPGVKLASPHARPGAAAQFPSHAGSLPPVVLPHLPAAHGRGDVAPGHQYAAGQGKQSSTDSESVALDRPAPHDVGADEFDGQK